MPRQMPRRMDDVDGAIAEEVDRVREDVAEGLPRQESEIIDAAGSGFGAFVGLVRGYLINVRELERSPQRQQIPFKVVVRANGDLVRTVQEIQRSMPDYEPRVGIGEVGGCPDVVPVDVGEDNVVNVIGSQTA